MHSIASFIVVLITAVSHCQSALHFLDWKAENCPQHLLSTEESVFELLSTLDITKSTGCDGISPKILKHTASSVALLQSKLINMSISTGKFPKEWKLARVISIPKGTNVSSPAGYKPIIIYINIACGDQNY